jgi:hypothetical protein
VILSLVDRREITIEAGPRLANRTHRRVSLPQTQDGPVAITYEFEVDRVREDEFMELMRQVRLIHLRNGTFSWQLHEDLTQFNILRVE